MTDTEAYKSFLTSLIKKQMLILGQEATLKKTAAIKGIKIENDGTVSEITANPNQITEAVLTAFMEFPARVAAKEVIAAKSQEEKNLRNTIESGWLQIEQEKANLLASINNLALGYITTDVELKFLTINPAVDQILGKSQDREWTIGELQNNILDQFYLPLECNKCMETGKPLPPVEFNYDKKRLRVFISPITSIGKVTETTGVTIMLQDLGTRTEPLSKPADPNLSAI